MYGTGVMGSFSASLLMTLLYLARMSRPDLMFTVTQLARQITRWTELADKQLHRLFCYLAGAVDFKLQSKIDRRDRDSLCLGCYPDADHAGCAESARSTSGGWAEIEGATSLAGIDWYSKRQGSISLSTTEAEMVSADKMLREQSIPMQTFWCLLLGYSPCIKLYEDNKTTIMTVASGYSQKLRYIDRTQRVVLGFIHERCAEPDCLMSYIESDKQKGDLFTKILTKIKLDAANLMIRLLPG